MESNSEKRIRLAINIILYLLLAFSFFSLYDVEVQKNIRGGEVEYSGVGSETFLWGILAIVLLFFAYTFDLRVFEYFGYIVTTIFILMFGYIFVSTTMRAELGVRGIKGWEVVTTFFEFAGIWFSTLRGKFILAIVLILLLLAIVWLLKIKKLKTNKFL